MKTMLVIGGDKIAIKALSLPEVRKNEVVLVKDVSVNFVKIINLIIKRRLSFKLFCKMFYCEAVRRRSSEKVKPYFIIKNNEDLIKLINEHKPQKIILFRAGLVVNKKILSMEIPIMNIHCAKIPEYGGLGSINEALKNNEINQFATLHQVTETIDSGQILDTEPYILNEALSYCKNETIAYEAGLRLLQRAIFF